MTITEAPKCFYKEMLYSVIHNSLYRLLIIIRINEISLLKKVSRKGVTKVVLKDKMLTYFYDVGRI